MTWGLVGGAVLELRNLVSEFWDLGIWGLELLNHGVMGAWRPGPGLWHRHSGTIGALLVWGFLVLVLV